MNQQIIGYLKIGILVGAIAAIIEMIISAAMLKFEGHAIDPVALVFGGLTIGLTTLILTVIISAIIAKRKQRI